jgi:hypothetical protein
MSAGAFQASAMRNMPYVELPSRLPTVHRHESASGIVRSSGHFPAFGDVDCAGGGGNAPFFVTGPVRVPGADPHNLDRDGDGIGCE